MKWISTKDRLPKKGEKVLGFVSGEFRVGYYTKESISQHLSGPKKINKGHFKDIVGYWDLCYLTHWMPLPDPPEE